MGNLTSCRCGRCNRVLRSAEAIEVGLGSSCCRKATGKTIRQVLKERREEAAREAADGNETE